MTLVLVTGASRGIGRELCRQLLDRGCTVIAGVRDPAQAPEGTEPLALDVAEGDSVAAAAEAVRQAHGFIDVLVNNAAILLAEVDEDLLHLPEDALLETLDTNLLGPLRIVQAFAPLLRKGGRIVNVSSEGASLSSPSNWSPAYCLSKTALNGLTGQLSVALKAKGISVNAACPGWVRTDMGGAGAPRSVVEGASGLAWLCLEAPASLTGKFMRDGKEIPW
ncbi:MAG TPA: SDR family NAD(P)-dependent oxidoreductase [Holophagaceae bacterium]|nr:SDR family NAD(P)-dependent oxidoreductase [Holophagaceae bacterium]